MKKLHYIGPLPRDEYYGIDSTMPRKKQFLEWCQNNRVETSDLQNVVLNCCQQDECVLSWT